MTGDTELAATAKASPSLTSNHLRRLLEGGLVVGQSRGRQRWYRLAGVEVAEMLEVMQVIAPAVPVTTPRGANTQRRLRRARLCYDHLAGVLGTAITDALVKREALDRHDDTLLLGRDADAVLAEVGIDVPVVVDATRPTVKQCTDWTERRVHVSGGIGAVVAAALIERRWVVCRTGSRGLDVSVDGAACLDDWLGLRVLEIDAWRESAQT